MTYGKRSTPKASLVVVEAGVSLLLKAEDGGLKVRF